MLKLDSLCFILEIGPHPTGFGGLGLAAREILC